MEVGSTGKAYQGRRRSGRDTPAGPAMGLSDWTPTATTRGGGMGLKGGEPPPGRIEQHLQSWGRRGSGLHQRGNGWAERATRRWAGEGAGKAKEKGQEGRAKAKAKAQAKAQVGDRSGAEWNEDGRRGTGRHGLVHTLVISGPNQLASQRGRCWPLDWMTRTGTEGIEQSAHYASQHNRRTTNKA